jgi:Flp pilus assembly protein CpaB
LKRSNRLILLIGVFLAIVAFIGVILLLSTPSQTPNGNQGEVTKTKIVKAVVDIPLGTIVTADMVAEEEVNLADAPAGAIHLAASAIGRTVRTNVLTGQIILETTFTGTATAVDIQVPPGGRAFPLQVDQITGVGTLIKPGDYVDIVIGLTSSSFPVVTVNPDDQSITVVQGLNGDSVKLLLQSVQVIQTILPPPPTDANGAPIAGGGVVLNGQQEIVIVSGTANQIEVLKFLQMDANVSLVLRSAADFQERDPVTNAVIIPVDEITDGVILKTLIDKYGVLRPQLIEALLPTPVP